MKYPTVGKRINGWVHNPIVEIQDDLKDLTKSQKNKLDEFLQESGLKSYKGEAKRLKIPFTPMTGINTRANSLTLQDLDDYLDSKNTPFSYNPSKHKPFFFTQESLDQVAEDPVANLMKYRDKYLNNQQLKEHIESGENVSNFVRPMNERDIFEHTVERNPLFGRPHAETVRTSYDLDPIHPDLMLKQIPESENKFQVTKDRHDKDFLNRLESSWEKKDEKYKKKQNYLNKKKKLPQLANEVLNERNQYTLPELAKSNESILTTTENGLKLSDMRRENRDVQLDLLYKKHEREKAELKEYLKSKGITKREEVKRHKEELNSKQRLDYKTLTGEYSFNRDNSATPIINTERNIVDLSNDSINKQEEFALRVKLKSKKKTPEEIDLAIQELRKKREEPVPEQPPQAVEITSRLSSLKNPIYYKKLNEEKQKALLQKKEQRELQSKGIPLPQAAKQTESPVTLPQAAKSVENNNPVNNGLLQQNNELKNIDDQIESEASNLRMNLKKDAIRNKMSNDFIERKIKHFKETRRRELYGN